MPQNRISKLADGRYTYSVTTSNGKRLRLNSRKNEMKRAFSKRCDALDRQAQEGFYEETLDELFYMWLDQYVVNQFSKSYYNSCKYHYEKHVQGILGGRKISDISRAEVFKLLAELDKKGYSKSTLNKVRTAISAPYNWAINALGYTVNSPTYGLVYQKKRTEDQKKNRIISDHDLERILKAASSTKYANYFRIISLTGLRPSECLGLQIGDIKPNVLQIRRGITAYGLSPLKTHAGVRDIPLHTELRKALYDQAQKVAFETADGWLFPSDNGYPSMNALQTAFKRILKQTEVWERGGRNHLKKLRLVTPAVDCRLYDFRHTFATKMAENGMNATALKHIMGHEDIKTTLSYYVDLTDQMLEEAADIMENSL